MIVQPGAAQSGYTDVDESLDSSKYVRRLDQMRRDSFWQAVKTQTFELLQVRPGSSVLDVGCGTGDDVLELARLVGPAGRAVGIDSSATMIDEAIRRASAAQSRAEFAMGDAHSLDFAAGSFDGCRIERVLQHLDAPARAVGELARVLKPGGRVVLVEPDYGTLAIFGADRAATEKILKVRREHFRGGRIGRQLAGLCRDAGLGQVSVTLRSMTNTVYTLASESAVLDKYIAGARAAGVITAAEGAAWLAELAAADEAGQYRHSLTLFIVSGLKS